MKKIIYVSPIKAFLGALFSLCFAIGDFHVLNTDTYLTDMFLRLILVLGFLLFVLCCAVHGVCTLLLQKKQCI